jgi:hypothetical protein
MVLTGGISMSGKCGEMAVGLIAAHGSQILLHHWTLSLHVISWK